MIPKVYIDNSRMTSLEVGAGKALVTLVAKTIPSLYAGYEPTIIIIELPADMALRLAASLGEAAGASCAEKGKGG